MFPIFWLPLTHLILSSVALYQKGEDVTYRLPSDVKPYEYLLSFEIHEQANVGSGHVEIKVQAVRNTHQIVLHAHPTLLISNSSVEVSSRINL